MTAPALTTMTPTQATKTSTEDSKHATMAARVGAQAQDIENSQVRIICIRFTTINSSLLARRKRLGSVYKHAHIRLKNVKCLSHDQTKMD